MKTFRSHSGFTLSELLIVLAIMALIATFSIPKIVGSASDVSSLSVSRSALTDLQSAYNRYLLDYELSPDVGFSVFLPYLGSATSPYTSTINADAGSGSLTCGSGNLVCHKLSSGVVVGYYSNQTFTQTASSATTNRCLPVIVDPDGQYSTTNNSKSVYVLLGYDGRLRLTSELSATCNYYNTSTLLDVPVTASSVAAPSWFSWR